VLYVVNSTESGDVRSMAKAAPLCHQKVCVIRRSV